jgi:hypothetical protein
MKWLARLLRCTEGQAYSAAIVAVIATVMLLVGVLPTLRDHPRTPAPAGPGAVTLSPTATPVPIPRFDQGATSTAVPTAP